MEIGEQENSSMTSYSSQLGYGVSKLISHFSFIMLNPSKLADKRLIKEVRIGHNVYGGVGGDTVDSIGQHW